MTRTRIGLLALSGFFGTGALIASVSCAALLFPSTGLGMIWRLNPDAQSAFETMGLWAIVLLAMVAIACLLSAVGLSLRAWWGRYLAVSVLLINMIGDVVNALVRYDLRTLVGLPIAGIVIFFLLTDGVRAQFPGPGRFSGGLL